MSPVELLDNLLEDKELKAFAAYWIKNDIKFNDWIRKLAYESLDD